MVTFEKEEVEFIKKYKNQCQQEIIQVSDFLKKDNKGIPKPFIDKAQNRLDDLQFLYHIFDKLDIFFEYEV